MTNTDDARRELAEITEKTSGHTSEPWHVEPDILGCKEIRGNGDRFFTTQARIGYTHGVEELTDHANAELIAAAPRLKEIATTLAQRVTELEEDMHTLLKRHVERPHGSRCECDLCWERRKITGRLFNYSIPEETQS